MLSFKLNWAIANAELPALQKVLGAKLHEAPYGVFDKMGFGSGGIAPSPPAGAASAMDFQA